MFRRHLSEQAVKPAAQTRVLEDAIALVVEEREKAAARAHAHRALVHSETIC